MRKLIRIGAMIFGGLAILTGTSSCKDDDPGIECCTLTESGTGYSYTIKACSDGTYELTVEYGGATTTTKGDFTEDGYTWDEVKADAKADGASCS